LNVRRLMYQTLIWPAVLRDEAGSLGSPLNGERVQGLANALIDRVVRDVEFGRDFFGRQMLVAQAQAIELPIREPRDTRSDHILRRLRPLIRGLRHAWIILQSSSHPASHGGLPSTSLRPA